MHQAHLPELDNGMCGRLERSKPIEHYLYKLFLGGIGGIINTLNLRAQMRIERSNFLHLNENI